MNTKEKIMEILEFDMNELEKEKFDDLINRRGDLPIYVNEVIKIFDVSVNLNLFKHIGWYNEKFGYIIPGSQNDGYEVLPIYLSKKPLRTSVR